MNSSQEPTLQASHRDEQPVSLQLQLFVTPISGALADGTATHVGTDGYVEWRRRRLLLTNEYVASELAPPQRPR